MLPILHNTPVSMAHGAAVVTLSLALFGCGKTPDSVASSPSGTGATTANDATGAAPGNGGSAMVIPLDCTPAAQPGAMVAVPQSDFSMGCNAAVDAECRPDENPLHTVTLAAFEIDKNEVTQEEFAACVEAGACTPPSSCTWDCSVPGKPAGCIEWAQAKAYCAFAGKRLPTEAEWEKAARGTDGRKFPWGNEPADCDRVNMLGCAGAASPVGSHPSGASPYGALDMAGNMVEMVADWYEATFYAASPAANPKGPASGTRYGGRGGGYRSESEWQRVSARDWYDLTDTGTSLGFRCAR
jgi:formylglycine-generating enzyme required for sulfatase activity